MRGKKYSKRQQSVFRNVQIKTWRLYKHIIQVAVVVLCVVAVLFGRKAVLRSCSGKQVRQTIDSREYNGIDVSKHNGTIDWKKVAEDKRIQFVYVKATEGASRQDRMYKRNIERARAAGIKVGSYHFFLSWRTAREQFDNFRKTVDMSRQDLVPMVDVEEHGCRTASRADLQENLNEFMRLVKEEYGVYPVLYSQYRFYNHMLAPEFNKYYIFIARYGDKRPTLNGDGKYNIWQYTEEGKVQGISTAVDLDRFENGTNLSDISL